MRKVRGSSVICGVLVLLAGCTAGPGPPAASSPAGPAPCRSTVTSDALPAWARGGFTGDGSGNPHVVSERGDLIAVLFDYPPRAGKDPQAGNKILWISRPPQQPLQPLRIEATLDGTTTPVERQVPEGAGPSTVQLPRPGCWRLQLTWSGHQDRMMLRFT